MKRVIHFLINRHQDILRYLLVMIAILAIGWWLPEAGKFKYDFTKSKPWRYDNLIAPFDFAILKNEAELEKERANIRESFVPYYRYYESVRQQQLQAFESAFAKAYSTWRKEQQRERKADYRFWRSGNDSMRHLRAGRVLLDTLFGQGIIRLREEHTAGRDQPQVHLLRNNIAEKVPVSRLLTLSRARNYLDKQLENRPRLDADLLKSLLTDHLMYNIFYDDTLSHKILEEQLADISQTRGMVQEGEIIIAKGAIVTPEKYRVLQSLKAAYESATGGEHRHWMLMTGYLLLLVMAFAVLMLYFYLFEQNIYQSIRKLTFILFVMVLMSSLSGWLVRADATNMLIIPLCVVPILIRAFFNVRTALYMLIIAVLINALIVPDSFEFIALNILAGLVAIFTNVKLHYRSQFFISSAFILLTYVLGYTGLTLIQTDSFSDIAWSNYGWLTINVLLTLLAYPLLPFFEKIFGLVSEITLFELSDLNKPLLRELSHKAPGSFQHSLQVANLAELAALSTGANPLLTRVGALYHDIGKMDKPAYFIENQAGTVNPHDKLSFEESAAIIINHVPHGVKLAKKKGLPEVLIDFIRTHHGTSRVEYFYQNFLKNYPEKFVDEHKFRYPGPEPFSRETAVVMLADSVEAASRSLQQPDEAQIDHLVDRIIDSKIKQDQLIHAEITFKHITAIKKLFKKRLKSIYHVRVAYPEEGQG